LDLGGVEHTFSLANLSGVTIESKTGARWTLDHVTGKQALEWKRYLQQAIPDVSNLSWFESQYGDHTMRLEWQA
jgi:hypothetical protein